MTSSMAASRRLLQLLGRMSRSNCKQQQQPQELLRWGHHKHYATVSPLQPDVTREFEEVRIEVPWGHVAGKWYGPKDVRPLVGLHGWQDNAGTFDTLAPLLPENLSLLCLDMPGHGRSSWLPDGSHYHSIDYVSLVRHLMEHFKWDKISLMGHSMSSINSFVFTALFPDKVDLLIGLDVLKPLTRSPAKIVDLYGERMENILKVEKHMRDKTPAPCYEWDELVQRLHEGTQKSIDLDCCKHLLQRNVLPSPDAPNKYYFSRDSRLKVSLFYAFSQEVPLEMARRIKVPHLFIKALQGPYYERKEYYYEALEVLRKNPLFEYHEVDGSHHVHLNEPVKISEIINPFLNKWRTQ